MTDEVGDTWRRAGTVDIEITTNDKTYAKNKKNGRGASKRCSFLVLSCNQMGLIKKHQHDMKEAQMMTSEEALGLSDRVRTGGRMTTAKASDDGGVTAVFFWRGRQRRLKYFRLGTTTDSWSLSTHFS